MNNSRKGVLLAVVAAAAVGFLLGYLLGQSGQATSSGVRAAAPTAGKVPRIQLVEPFFNFGSIRRGETLEHDFVFRNAGQAPLQVTKVTTSCGCTATVLSQDVIQPGASGTVHAKFDSASFVDEVQVRINLFSNDPATPVATARIGGKVTTAIRVDPAALEFGSMRDGERKEASLVVRATERGPFEIVSAEPTSDRVELGKPVPDPGAPGLAWRIPVRVHGRPPFGYVWDEVRIRTTHPDGKEFHVKAAWTVAAPSEKEKAAPEHQESP